MAKQTESSNTGYLESKSAAIGLVVLSTVAALLLGEFLLRVVLNPGDFLLATLVDDPVLGHRIEPHATGHDALGFRNATAPERSNIVAIGDSQTYGVSAPREGSWPHQLGVLMREPVYNMALGGYGPLEYLHLAGHVARKLRPQLLLVGFYFGNDLIEACRAAQQRPHWRAWREAGSADICDAESPQASPAEPGKRFAAIRDWLSRRSMFYALLRTAFSAQLSTFSGSRAAQEVSPDRQMAWNDPADATVGTVFTPQYRLSSLDPRLPRVQQGLRLTGRAFASMKSDADADGVRLVVILIPTKERAYCPYLKDSGGQLPESFLALCDAEDRIKADLVQFLTAAKIAYVDVTDAIDEKIRAHVQIYPADSDGHPRATGYRAIARAVYDALYHQRRPPS